ncbi:hypothetical protein [Mucilaginibacter sp. CSA2-8R]|uniref:hypothetical protein n=1 Tax=Mucilaginibacter sp. CSA2-8R TaxID=3141542 RepID=UPI00315D6AEB
MKRITFLAAFIVALMSFGAKAQVYGHVGVNIGRPAYYAPPQRRVVVVERQPRRYYHRRQVVVRRGYYGPRRPVVIQRYRRPHRVYGHRRW